MKKIVLILSSNPQFGGSFQYEQTILDAVLNLSIAQFEIIYIYTDEIWEEYLPNNINKTKIILNHNSKRLLQFLLIINFPILFLRKILPKVHVFAKSLFNLNADLYIFPSQETSWSYLINIPSLGVIHDLMHRYERKFPEVSGKGRFLYREKHFRYMTKFSKGILVDSVCGQKQVITSYNVYEGKIFPLPFIPPKYIRDNVTKSNKFNTLPDKYFFYPAQFWDHKNHKNLIKAIYYLKLDIPEIQLVLVGAKKNRYNDIIALILKLKLEQSVHVLGYVPEEELPLLYKKARAMIMPTFFGPTNIPPIEAFALNCPVAVSNIYGLPEQVGDAALLFDPTSIDEIKNVLERLWNDDKLCHELSRKGKIRSNNWGEGKFNDEFHNIINNLIH